MAKKALFVISQNNFRDEELLKPREILGKAGYETKVASVTTDAARGMFGTTVKPDLSADSAAMKDYDMLIIVGGSGAPSLMEQEGVLELIRDAHGMNKTIGAICLGPMVLARAGILNSKRVTVFETSESVNLLRQAGAVIVKKDVVVDGRLVTANGPGAAADFANELLRVDR